MKKTGIAIIISGLLLTAFTGFGFFTQKNVEEISNPGFSETNTQQVNWTPYAGVGLFLVGGMVLLTGIKKIQ